MEDSFNRSSSSGRPDVSAALKRVFGFDSFRPNQREIVEAVLGGRDVFAVMPTGGGKSLCYQLPAHLLDGVCVVVSPLISLMKDQVDGARDNGLRAEFLNSSLVGADRARVVRALRAGELDLLYLAPERFAIEGFAESLADWRPAMFAVDEAHCISEWGHDFRPDYLSLARIVQLFPSVPVAAFTATATQRVQDDIIGRLGLRNPLVVRASFNRPNLFYSVTPKTAVSSQLLAFVRDRPNESGIIYRTTRKAVESTADFLTGHGIRALPYHAGLDAKARQQHQDAFNNDDVNVIVATIAFGMGIDKSNVRFVLHGDLPKNIEGYYQETGRAGRDGEPAACTLFFSAGDIAKIRYFIDRIEDEGERRIAAGKLNEMANYATANACRRRQLLAYFGERLEHGNCGTCDVCTGAAARSDATREAQIFMSAVARTGERFGAGYLIDIVTGELTERVARFGHDRIKTFGAGREHDKRFWRWIADDLLAQGCLHRQGEPYPSLRLTDSGRDVLFGRRKFEVLERPKRAERKRRPPAGDAQAGPVDQTLFDRLRGLRRTLAAAMGMPPYVVFSDRTLREMSARRPATLDELRLIPGVGDYKLRQYGQAFLDAIRSEE